MTAASKMLGTVRAAIEDAARTSPGLMGAHWKLLQGDEGERLASAAIRAMTAGTPALDAPPRSREQAALDIAAKALIEISKREIGEPIAKITAEVTLAKIATLREGAEK